MCTSGIYIVKNRLNAKEIKIMWNERRACGFQCMNGPHSVPGGVILLCNLAKLQPDICN